MPTPIPATAMHFGKVGALGLDRQGRLARGWIVTDDVPLVALHSDDPLALPGPGAST